MATQIRWIAVLVVGLVGLALAILLPHAQAGKTQPSPAVKFSLELLPMLSGSTAAYAGKMNAQGDVAGQTNGAARGFTGDRGFLCLYRNGRYEAVELNDLVFYAETPREIVPALDPTSTDSQSPTVDWLSEPKPFIVSANDISDVGQVTGAFWFRCKGPGLQTTTETGDLGTVTHHWMVNAYRYDAVSHRFEGLGTVANQRGSRGVAISNSGDVLCVTEAPDPAIGGPLEYFIRTTADAEPIALDGIPAASDLLIGQINESGEVAGTRYEYSYQRGAQAFVYNYITGDYTPLGYLNNAPRRTQPQSWGVGLNSVSSRQTVGGSVTTNDGQDIVHVYRHTQGVGMKDLGILANGYKAYGQGVNKWGDVVGLCYMDARGSWQHRAFVYLDGLGMLDVWKLIVEPLSTNGDIYSPSFPALSINDSGWIAGTLDTGQPFILRPIQWVR